MRPMRRSSTHPRRFCNPLRRWSWRLAALFGLPVPPRHARDFGAVAASGVFARDLGDLRKQALLKGNRLKAHADKARRDDMKLVFLRFIARIGEMGDLHPSHA